MKPDRRPQLSPGGAEDLARGARGLLLDSVEPREDSQLVEIGKSLNTFLNQLRPLFSLIFECTHPQAHRSSQVV